MSQLDNYYERRPEAPRPVERRLDVLSKAIWLIDQAAPDEVEQAKTFQSTPDDQEHIEASDLNITSINRTRREAKDQAKTMQEGRDHVFQAAA